MSGKTLTLEEAKAAMNERYLASKNAGKKKSRSTKPVDPSKPVKKRAKPIPHEALAQKSLLEQLSYMRSGSGPMSEVYDHLFHVPNGGVRDYKTAKEMKVTGVKKGVSDLILPIARGGYFSLYIEFKAGGSNARSISGEQVDWLRMMEAKGHATALCHGAQEALDVIEAYMSLPPTPINEKPFTFGRDWRSKSGKKT